MQLVHICLNEAGQGVRMSNIAAHCAADGGHLSDDCFYTGRNGEGIAADGRHDMNAEICCTLQNSQS